jgi:hypothetical protein
VDAVAADLTVSQKIILAAHRLEEQGQTPFTSEALTMACWKESKQTFGLKGFAEEHPDNNRVLACIMGERGLAKRGWLVKVGPKLYSLSKQGKDEARRVLAGDDTQTPRRRALSQIKLPRDVERQLLDALNSNAHRRYIQNMKRDITFKDASKFWGLPENAIGEAVDEALGKVPKLVETVEQLLIGESVELSNGQSVSQSELNSLKTAHRYLTEQFTRHLSQMRERSRRF